MSRQALHRDGVEANDEEEETTSQHTKGKTDHIDFVRIQHKIDNLPTMEKLLQEEDPTAYSAEQLHEASCFVRDLLLSTPLATQQDVERHQRRLQKKYRQVFKKSLLLAAYKHILCEGAPAGERAAGEEAEGAKLSKRQLKRLARQRQQEQERHPDEEGGVTEVSPVPQAERSNDMEDLVPDMKRERRDTDPTKGKDRVDANTPSDGSARMPVSPSPVLERFLVSKAPRSQSGVLVVTVFTSPYPDGQRFSCQWNCYYCPNEPDQPRSYLLNEPGVRRANLLDFDPYRQFTERVRSLVAIGHPADKVELLVLGGTWESYPLGYRTRFIRDLFYAANTMFDHEDGAGSGESVSLAESRGGACFAPSRASASPAIHEGGAPEDADTTVHDTSDRLRHRRRPPLDLLQEQLMNEHARCKIIGVTLETRPDTINTAMLKELRRFGCTRVQLGVQHTDDAILTKVNRQATREDTMQAIKLLKDACFKVDIHLMPDLPGATPEIDKAMFDDVLNSPYLQADQWKIYPCQTTPFTVIEEWYKQGLYTPYGLENLIDVLLYVKTRVQPWVRLNRVVRDIPVDYVLAGVEVANLRQLLAITLKQRGERCQCIRCREVKGDSHVADKLKAATLKERVYEASEGTETFLSFDTPDEATIFGFLRLRTNMRNVECPFPELQGCALIRELHVYGHLIPTYATDGTEDASAADVSLENGAKASPKAQHMGLGTRLLQRAEDIAKAAGYHRIAVISGVGVRGYYRRRGYRLYASHQGGYLIKDLVPPTPVDAAALSASSLPERWAGREGEGPHQWTRPSPSGREGNRGTAGDGSPAPSDNNGNASRLDAWRQTLVRWWQRVGGPFNAKRERDGE